LFFVDDKLKNILELENYCKESEILFWGFRYGYLDGKREKFDIKIADIQYQLFPEILSDEKAEKLLKN
jgi:hypothetical protein